MRRFGLTLSVATSFAVAAIIASCSSDGSPISSPDGGTPGLSSADLNGGGWSPTVESAANNEGKVTVCHSGNGKNFTQITVSPQGARAHLGDPTTGKGGHANDFRVSNATPCPPGTSANPGQVQVCKVAGTGVNAGTNFTFTLTANGTPKTVTVAAGAAPTGNCVNAGSFAVGTTVAISEGAQTGVNTSGITVAPAGAQQGTSDLPNRSATIIAGSGTTTVTYTNTTSATSSGTLVICKVGGTGVNAGTNFTFNYGFNAGGPTQAVTVAAGAGPAGTCSTPIQLTAGNVIVTETATSGTITESINGTPAPTNVSLAGRTGTVTVAQGQQSTITFTNTASSSANSGTLVVCKVAGTGVNTGTNSTFSVSGQPLTVAAGAGPTGTCSSAMTLPVGTVSVSEASQTGVSVTSISGTPAAPTNVNLANRSANVAIAAGQQTTITFTNTATANTGTLVICKIGGTGVTAGTNFNFTVGGQTVTVAAGAAPNGTCGTAITLATGTTTVSENASAGTSVSAITGSPATPTNINLGSRSATVAINTGQETRITFTNTAP